MVGGPHNMVVPGETRADRMSRRYSRVARSHSLAAEKYEDADLVERRYVWMPLVPRTVLGQHDQRQLTARVLNSDEPRRRRAGDQGRS